MITGRIDPSVLNGSRVALYLHAGDHRVVWVEGDAERLAKAVQTLTAEHRVEQWEVEVNGCQRFLLQSEPFRRLAEQGVTFVPVYVVAA